MNFKLYKFEKICAAFYFLCCELQKLLIPRSAEPLAPMTLAAFLEPPYRALSRLSSFPVSAFGSGQASNSAIRMVSIWLDGTVGCSSTFQSTAPIVDLVEHSGFGSIYSLNGIFPLPNAKNSRFCRQGGEKINKYQARVNCLRQFLYHRQCCRRGLKKVS